jgi:GNAT superfamily N-acetyltransferase
MSDEQKPTLRVATTEDMPALDVLMKQSAEALFPSYYGKRRTRSAVRYVAQVDSMLVSDGTFFVLETEGELVGCGGWSRRHKPYTGSGESADDGRLLDPATEAANVRAMFVRADWTRRGLGRRILEACEEAARREGFLRLTLMATLPGVPLYLAHGFRPFEESEIALEDGVRLECVSMEKPIDERPMRATVGRNWDRTSDLTRVNQW